MIIRDIKSRAAFNPGKMGKTSLSSGTYLYAGLNAFEPGQAHSAHVHADQDKLYLILEGRGEVTVGDETSEVGPGGLVLAPAGVSHALRNPGPHRLIVLVVFSPPPSK